MLARSASGSSGLTSTLHDQLALGDAYLLERKLLAGGMSLLFLITERALELQPRFPPSFP
jgi:hypothetical protein